MGFFSKLFLAMLASVFMVSGLNELSNNDLASNEPTIPTGFDDFDDDYDDQDEPRFEEKEATRLTKEEALEIALNDAKATKSEVRDLEVEFDEDDGVEYFEIEFKFDGSEYEYEIHAVSGNIIEREIEKEIEVTTTIKDHDDDDDRYDDDSDDDRYEDDYDDVYDDLDDDRYDDLDDDDDYKRPVTRTITRQEAKNIAFNHAGVSAGSVRELEVELDEDDGFLVYEVEFQVRYKEYEYEINAKTGSIIDFEIEIDD